METLYPIYYGTRMVTFDELRNRFEPNMHPEAARRGFNFIKYHGGKFGIGGGYRPPGTQPNKAGFAPPGRSFHEGQQFPSGLYYCAWDMVVANPGRKHRAPTWDEVPKQGSQGAVDFGVHMNVSGEPWHLQPIELDGWATWVKYGKQDLLLNYDILVKDASFEPEKPTTNPEREGITVEFNSRTLRRGDKGSDVKFFQGLINDLAGQGLYVDGDFGPQTERGVKNWQAMFGLVVDGVVGKQTQQSLIEIALLKS